MPDPGRPTKLTPAIQEKIVQALSIGSYRGDAAEYAGIDPKTLRRWLVRGIQEPESEYGDFRSAVLEAESRAKVTAMSCITKASRGGDWKAAAYWLERKHPHQFAERSQLFLIAKAFEQVEAAAEAQGLPIPESVWMTAWGNLAQDVARKFTAQAGIDGGLRLDEEEDDDFGGAEISAEEREVLFKLLRQSKRNEHPPSEAESA